MSYKRINKTKSVKKKSPTKTQTLKRPQYYSQAEFLKLSNELKNIPSEGYYMGSKYIKFIIPWKVGSGQRKSLAVYVYKSGRIIGDYYDEKKDFRERRQIGWIKEIDNAFEQMRKIIHREKIKYLGVSRYDLDHNYYVNGRKVNYAEYMKKFKDLRKREKELGKTIFHATTDDTQSEIRTKK